jgi:hypothetical protein
MVFQEILSKEEAAVFVQDKESQVASSSNSFIWTGFSFAACRAHFLSVASSICVPSGRKQRTESAAESAVSVR